MKVVALVGSPRKGGNTDVLIQKALDGAREQGSEVETFYLNELDIRGCQACYTCKKTGNCAVHDDLTAVYQSINAADAVLIGSPIYFGRFTAQLALFMDRLYSYIKADRTSSLPVGKKIGLIFTQGQEDAALYKTTIDATESVLNRLGFSVPASPLIAGGVRGAGDVREKSSLLQRAYELGQIIAGQ